MTHKNQLNHAEQQPHRMVKIYQMIVPRRGVRGGGGGGGGGGGTMLQTVQEFNSLFLIFFKNFICLA